MSRRPAALSRGRARGGGLLIAVAAVVSLTAGCSAGQVAATAKDVAAIEGSGAYRGGLAVRDVRIATPPTGSYRAGDDAPLYGSITTDASTTDTLVGIRAAAATGVSVVHVLGGSASGVLPASPSAVSSATSGALNLKLTYDSLLVYKDGGDFLQLHGLTRDLVPGQTVTMTFTFAQAGDITLQVPVATSNIPEPRLSPSPALTE